MEDREIYKHLANVYLSNSPVKKNKKTKINPIFSLLTINTFIIAALLIVVIFDRLNHPSPFKIATYTLNINDNDHPLKVKYSLCNPFWHKNQISLYFDNIDISTFRNMRIFVKGDRDFTKRVVLFLYNKSGSKAVSFLNEITPDWKVFVVPLNSFEGIKDLSVINRISFGIENQQFNEFNGNVFIGDITFLR